MAVNGAVLLTHKVAVATGAIITAIAVVVRRLVILAVILSCKKVAILSQATLYVTNILLGVTSDVICSSAGLNFIVQL